MGQYCRWCAVVGCLLAGAPAMAQPSFVFDYSFDTNNFFTAGSAQRVALETAGARLAARLGDSLTAITPGGSNTWTAQFFNPANPFGASASVSNRTVVANTIVVYAGGAVLGGNTLGIGGPGGFGVSGTQAFVDTVVGRGQSGALGAAASRTDFGPWGGSISFDTTRNWNYSVASGPTGSQPDFLSVAEHELGHLLGFGTANSFANRISGTNFTGPKSTQLNGGVNPQVTSDGGHWAQTTAYQGQEAAMTPAISLGARKEFTDLDFAGLSDMGWQVSFAPVPEPATVLAASALVLAAVGRLRRREDRTPGLAA